jgi:hypothetical protein
MCVTHWFVRPEHALWRHKQRRKKRTAVCCRPDACTGRGAQQGVANGSLPVTQPGSLAPAFLDGVTVVLCIGMLCLPHIFVPFAVWPPFFCQSVRTRREQHACMHCAACRSRHEERERRESAFRCALSCCCTESPDRCVGRTRVNFGP